MTHIKRKSLSILLCFVLMFSMTIPASARASEYFHRTSISATHQGNGTLRIKVDLAATGTMQEVGAKEIIVYEKKPGGGYDDVYTFTQEAYPSLITQNRLSYITYVTFYGSPGKTYYLLCAFYAKNSSGSQILWGNSSSIYT